MVVHDRAQLGVVKDALPTWSIYIPMAAQEHQTIAIQTTATGGPDIRARHGLAPTDFDLVLFARGRQMVRVKVATVSRAEEEEVVSTSRCEEAALKGTISLGLAGNIRVDSVLGDLRCVRVHGNDVDARPVRAKGHVVGATGWVAE